MAESSGQRIVCIDGEIFVSQSFKYIECPECRVESRSGNIHKPECTNDTNASGASANIKVTNLEKYFNGLGPFGLPRSKSAMSGANPTAIPATKSAAKPPETQ